jgi:hypothetical protein
MNIQNTGGLPPTIMVALSRCWFPIVNKILEGQTYRIQIRSLIIILKFVGLTLHAFSSLSPFTY